MRTSSKTEALKYYTKIKNEFKVEIINDFKDEEITFCDHSNFSDLCKGGHIMNTKLIKSIKLLYHAEMSNMTDKINVYSFALKPEEHQPSGTCNFSRIDNAILKLNGKSTMTASEGENGVEMSNAVLKIYAVNYNVLRIMSGMGGLAYSN